MTTPAEAQPGADRTGGPAASRRAGIAAVAATYGFFLLWAQFGFVELLQDRLGGAVDGGGAVRAAMGAMGVAGLAGSFGTAALLARVDPRRLVRLGLLAAPATALASLACRSLPAFVAVSAATGAATAVLTVSLAAGLRALVGGRRLGLAVGSATGAAYALCNLPGVFDAPPARQVLLVALACGAAWLALGAPAAARAPETVRDLVRPGYCRGLGLAALVVAFLALVWIDSAAFAAIQERPELAAGTWGTAGGRLLLGTAHLLAALVAGALLDAGLLLPVLAATGGAFGVALPLLAAGAVAAPLWGMLYAAGISAYSTALVVFPAGRRDDPRVVPARWRAGLVYGVAGWLGSALGVGMAQDLQRLPGAAVATAVGLVASACTVAWWVDRRSGHRPLGSRVRLAVGVWGPALVLAAAVLAGLGGERVLSAGAAPRHASAVARGRRVYRAEGCIHCHSQYVRPRTGDEEVWGPHRALDRSQAPPLVGVRRQGPDLANVGNRRSAAWQRLHLLEPRALDPSSRMPAYAHLFTARPGEPSRGEDLVAYLGALGRGTEPARQALIEAAPVPGTEGIERASVASGRRLFGRYCAACHGAAGRGDGRFAAALHRPGMDLGKGALWSVSWGAGGGEPEPAALARLIRFGIAGTAMPGHESLTEEQVSDLVAFVETVLDGGPTRERSAGAGAAR